jgi:hypothetical protein
MSENSRQEKQKEKTSLKLLTSKEVSGILRVSIRTLQSYRDQGIIPFFQMGRLILYKPEDIQEFIDFHYNKPRFWDSMEGGEK